MPEITMAKWIVRSLVDYPLEGRRTRGRQNSLASELAFFSLATQTSERLVNLSDFSRLLSATITRANLAIWEFSIAARTVLRKEKSFWE